MTLFSALEWSRFPLPAVLALLLTSCPEEGPRAAFARLPFGSLDIPRNGETVHGRTLIRGWALDESGIQSVAIYFDRKLAAFAILDIDRPDVQQVFPTMPGVAHCGYQFEFVATGIQPGIHELLVQARSKQGATRDLGVATITIAP